MLNWHLVQSFAASCKSVGVEPPPSISKALHVLTVARAAVADPVVSSLLDLSDDGVREHVEALSVRQHLAMHGVADRGLRVGVELLDTQLAAEVRAVIVAELDRAIESVQSRFAEAAKPLEVAASRFNITASMSSDDLIDRADYEVAVPAWREMRRAWFDVSPIVKWRIEASRVFALSPTLEQTRREGHLIIDENGVNYSVCFASGDGWDVDPAAYRTGRDRRQHMDWLSLAKSGLRLNTVSDVMAKLEARGIHSSEHKPEHKPEHEPEHEPTGDVDDHLTERRYPTSRSKGK